MVKMRIGAIILCGAALAAEVTAEDINRLRARGEALAKEGRYSEAIDAFKAADRIEPRAGHACLIALAYTRREMWPQAEIFIAKCHERVRPDDPAPDWAPKAEQQIAERLATAKVAPISIATDPAVSAKLTVSSFAPDESFPPRTIHLPPGHHVIFASADGYEPAKQEIDVRDNRPQKVVIHLVKPGEQPEAAAAVAAPPPAATPSRSRLPAKPILFAGAGVVAAGAVVNATFYLSARNQLAESTSLAEYQSRESAYDTSRTVMFGLYGLGAAAVITGVVFFVLDRDREPTVAMVPLRGGGIVAVEWRR